MTNNLLIYPTIDLFVYQLAEGLGQSDVEIAENRRNFWQKIYPDKLNDQQLKEFQQREAKTSDYISLLKTDAEKLFPEPQDGFYNPVKIGDTYGLQINCSSNKSKDFEPLDPREINSFQAIKKTIEQKYPTTKINEIKFGQSWFVWAKLTSPEQNPEIVAKNIYEQLQLFDNFAWEDTLKTDLNLINQNAFGATFFECWQLPSDRGDLSQNRHLLIALFPPNENNQFYQAINKNYPQLTRLFLSRHKIIWAYQNSRHYKAKLKEAAKEVQKRVEDLPNKVDNFVDPKKETDLGLLQRELAHTLNLMSSYAETLSDLEEQKNTIEANFKNYQRLVNDLNLPCLQAFIPIVSEKYLPQINSDLTSLNSGLRLLENSVRTIEGIINIEQAKGDRALNETIFEASQKQAEDALKLNETMRKDSQQQAEDALKLNQTFIAATAGLATSQVVSTLVIAYYPAKDKDGNSVSNPIFYLGSIFILSLVCGSLVFGLVRKILTSKAS
jgi:hypothetical protein